MAAFYLDEDIVQRLARLLVDRGHTAATTDDERRKGASDARQLLYAADRNWVLLTNNGEHYRLLHDAWLTWGHEWGVARQHAGILILSHVVAADLPLLAEAIRQIVSDDGIVLATALYEWSPTSGWRRWPRRTSQP